MAKVLISALGANAKREYKKANYLIEDKTYEEPFIGVALTKHYKIDRNIIIGTSKSLWEEYYKVYAEYLNKEYDEDLYLHLAEKIEENSISEEDLIPEKESVLVFTKGGYVKRTDPSEYRTQKRGGVGVVGMATKQEDEIESMLSVDTHD
jgi:DNA gyrase/topoisomerase IV subunit A